jgi:aspartyl-tRNA(Asn)/glutamyl-tRNA(Gln) amidotransferase subunit C
MTIGKKDVDYVATLARLKFTDEELLSFEKDLNNILVHFQKLNELDTDSIPPIAHVMDLKNRFREDVVKPSLDRDKALINASSIQDEYFKVPKIIE